MAVSVRLIAYGAAEYEDAVRLRRLTLRTPLGLDFSAEDLAREAGDTHFGAFYEGRLVGTVVLTPYSADTVKLRQMTVADDIRGEKIGAHLLSAFEAHARQAGVALIVLAARQTAQGFYGRYGYESDDVVFTEVTIPHVTMWKMLSV